MGEILAKPLVIIASERTGTNYLCNLLSHHPQVAAYYEIFANVAIMMTDAEVKNLCEAQSWPFTSRSDRTLIARFKSSPYRIIELIQNQLLADQKILSFKVFQDHLPIKTLAQLIEDYEAIVVTRRVIDTYVSFVKATTKDEWLRLDTTKIKPTLHIEDFIDWYRKRHDYYKLCANQYLKDHHREIEVLKYEDFTHGSNRENLVFVCKQIGDSIGICLDSPDTELDIEFWKQDKNPSVADKVENWAEFEKQLRKRDLFEVAFDSFLGPIESLYSSCL